MLRLDNIFAAEVACVVAVWVRCLGASSQSAPMVGGLSRLGLSAHTPNCHRYNADYVHKRPAGSIST